MITIVNKRKLLVTLILVVAAIFSACSNGGKISLDPKNPVAIVIWHYYHGAQKNAFDDFIKTFNETVGYEQGIIVEAVSYGGVGDLEENVIAAAKGELDAGAMPDIFGAYGDIALEVLKHEKAADISSYLTEDEIAEYEESFIHEGQIGTDKIYVFPIAKSTESLMVNKTDLDAFISGVAETGETITYDDLATWEGILDVADKYYRYTDELTPDIKNDGKALMGIDSLANYIIISSKQLGQDIVEIKEGKPIINADTNIMKKIWDLYYNAMVTGRFVKLGQFCSDDIKTGDSLCFIGSTSSSSYFPTELPLDDGGVKNIEFMVLPMPVFENADKVSISQGAGMVIAKSVKEKEYAASLFLKWFTESERNVLFSLSSSYLPVKKESLGDEILNAAFEEIESDDVGTQNTIKALKVGIEQLKNYTMYSSEVYDGSVDFRKNLPMVLADSAKEDRELYLELLESGMDVDEAFGQLQSDAKFEKWLNSIR